MNNKWRKFKEEKIKGIKSPTMADMEKITAEFLTENNLEKD